MTLPARTRVYQSAVSDSTRWDRFRPRAGDVIVCTPVKSGTTWTQMCCALLIHQSARFPQPLARLSRWLERLRDPIDEVIAAYEAQPHRRIVKTHTPLDGIPYWSEVSYVFCGRDPRDVFLSGIDHMNNASEETEQDMMRRLGVTERMELPDDPNVYFPIWLTSGAMDGLDDGFPMGSVMGLTKTYWAHRDAPNLFFLHYADLSADLDGEMRRLARFLGVRVDEDRWPELVAAARFASMRDRADELAPGAHFGEWRSNAEFFRSGRRGAWREVLSAASLAQYEQVATERLGPRLKAWLEGGRALGGDPKQP